MKRNFRFIVIEDAISGAKKILWGQNIDKYFSIEVADKEFLQKLKELKLKNRNDSRFFNRIDISNKGEMSALGVFDEDIEQFSKELIIPW